MYLECVSQLNNLTPNALNPQSFTFLKGRSFGLSRLHNIREEKCLIMVQKLRQALCASPNLYCTSTIIRTGALFPYYPFAGKKVPKDAVKFCKPTSWLGQ